MIKQILVLGCLLVASPSWASVIAYTTKASFDAAAGTTSMETFNSFVVDTDFRSAPLALSAFTLSSINASPVQGDNIDVAPHQFPELDFDGTPSLYGLIFLNSSFTLSFGAPIVSFGALFQSLQTSGSTSVISLAGSTYVPSVFDGETIRFIGFISSQPFTTVTFSGSANDGFGVDNVQFGRPVVTAVPEPEGLALLSLGALSFVIVRRRRN